jgi:hypothetical protein
MAVSMVAFLLPIVVPIILPPDPGPDPDSLPIYPGGHNVTRRDHTLTAAQDDGSGGLVQSGRRIGRITDYWADASPEAVRDFYEKVMPANGWSQVDQPQDGSLSFTYAVRSGWPRSIVRKMLFLTIATRSTPGSAGPDTTFVELEVFGSDR